MMKVAIVTQYYAPDHSATGQILHELASRMVELGDEVRVITGQPTYALSSRLPGQELLDGVAVKRVIVTRINKNKKFGKIMNSLTFFASALTAVLRCPREYTLLIVSNPPFLSVLGWLIYSMRKQPFVYLIHDIYPDIAIRLGYLKGGGFIVWAWEWLNAKVLASAAKVVVLSETMCEVVASKTHARPGDIHVIHNWANGVAIRPMLKSCNSFAQSHGLIDCFVFQYSGNMGLFHDLESLIVAAAHMSDLPVRFLLIGDGGKREKLIDMSKGLDNVTFLPYQPKSMLPLSLTACDAAVVTLEEGIEGLAAPSKLYGILAAGRAIVAIVEEGSYIRKILSNADCGIAVSPNDPAALEEALRHLARHPERAKQMGENGRKWFEENSTLEIGVAAYRRVLREVTEKGECISTSPLY